MTTVKKDLILIADDDPNIRKGLEKAVSEEFGESSEIITCENGKETSDILLQNAVDILITDIKMPFLTGIDLLKFIRNHHLHCKTVVLSGYDDYNLVRQALRTGAEDYLLKPVDFGLLAKTVRELLETVHHTSPSKAPAAPSAFPAFQGSPLPKSADAFSDFFDLPYEKIPGSRTNLSLNEYLSRAVAAASEYQYGKSIEELCAVFSIFSRQTPPVTEVKKTLIQMIYDLIAKNPKFIAPISASKFTSYDIFEQIETAKSLSLLQKQFFESLSHYTEQILRSLKDRDDQIIEQAKTYIESHYNDNISLEDTAAHVFLHSNYFSGLFKAKTGITYRQYLRNFRIEQAKKLILETDMKVYEVALSVGYNDSAHFVRAFKEVTGMNPKQYKEIAGNGAGHSKSGSLV